ncbi:DUF2867 domain-containing protein [Aquimonas sp.]|jgi:hypothetical protein|uniref:DUF2867 domain-containing protein n=1 Tax=Aquimonas sp. TaxID=1872588 RepID=UPI0037C06D2D
MNELASPSKGFPSVSLRNGADAAPIEVTLIAQLGPGAGDALIAQTAARQRAHPGFVDALEEPSARLGGMHLAHGDASSLYSFMVGVSGHPFHRHAGNRIFTAVAGSSGALLRFAHVDDAEMAADPQAFVRSLKHVRVPADSLFTVRFCGGTWHQFLPLDASGQHSALFALSCHTDELGGELSHAQRTQVLANAADIPSLTECVPSPVQALLDAGAQPAAEYRLSLCSPPHARAQQLCGALRGAVGRLRSQAQTLRVHLGWVERRRTHLQPRREHSIPDASLLHSALDGPSGSVGSVYLDLDPAWLDASKPSAAALLAQLLEGFVENPPRGVGLLMGLRNRLVRPLGLRTSSLGCPVSSLLSESCPQRYCGRFPVLDQRTDASARTAEVLLGADDRHLSFRASASVELRCDGRTRFRLATRVQTRNLFGRLYMALIRRTHETYVGPALLVHAVEHLLSRVEAGSPVTVEATVG